MPFTEHEWYKNLTALLKENAEQYGIGLQVIDADQNVRDEVDLRRRQIASKAATLVSRGCGAGGWRADCTVSGRRIETEKRYHRHHKFGGRV